MSTHRDQRRRGQHVAVLARQEQPDALVVFGAHDTPHALEVRQSARQYTRCGVRTMRFVDADGRSDVRVARTKEYSSCHDENDGNFEYLTLG